MRISVSMTNYSWPGGPAAIAEHVAEIARIAEDAGLDTVWVADHPLQSDPTSSWEEPMLAPYATLSYLAARTDRVRLGALVSGVTFRAPALLIKEVTTLDVLSGGRAWLGLGTGYNEAEARATGVYLPSMRARFDMLTDTLELARQMWAGDTAPFHGRQVSADNPIASPPPIHVPPILIGGTGRRRTLRLVAEHADACNLFDIPDGGTAVREQLDVLAGHCADVGRPYEQIERTITTALQPDMADADFVAHCAELGRLGIQHVVAISRGRPWTAAGVATLGAAATELAAA